MLIISPSMLCPTLSSEVSTSFSACYMKAVSLMFEVEFLSHQGDSLLYQLFHLLFRRTKSTINAGLISPKALYTSLNFH